MKRDSTVDIAKGIGIIFVIIGHMNHFFSYEGRALTIIYSFHMPLFLILSGYVFNWHTEVSMKDYCYRRFGQIMKPYFTFAAITLFFHCVCTGVMDTSAIYGIFIGNGINNHLNFNIALWFLPMLFLCNIFFWILVKFSKYVKKEKLSFLTLIVLAIFVTILGYFLIRRGKRLFWGIETAMFSQLFMALGYLFKQFNNRYDENLYYRRISICCCPLVAIIWWLGMRYNGRIDMNAGRYGNIFVFFITAVCGVYIVWHISKLISKIFLVNKLMSYLGLNSLYIMAYHIPAASIMYNGLLPYMPTIIINNAWERNVIGVSYIVVGGIVISLLMGVLHRYKER